MDTFHSMDSKTASLILQLQIEDSTNLLSSYEGKGKGIEGVLTDTQLALQLYTEELERNATIISDRHMTRSLARACQSDGDILALSFSQEQREARDRQVAMRLGGLDVPLAIAGIEVVANGEELDDEVIEKLNALYICAAEEPLDSDSRSADDQEGQDDSKALVPYNSPSSPGTESSKWAASRTSQVPKRHCTACRETFPSHDLSRVPCTHEYCRGCLHDLFNASLIDDTLFPPRCCRLPITPTASIRIYLPASIVRQYEAKKIEFDTPNRTYCSNPLCSSFIRIEYIAEEQATCQVCQVVTCTICKGAAHTGDCPDDEALKLRCYSCRRLVELDMGCNHMTAKWKTCRCAQWDEHRLYARAEVVVARQPAIHHQPAEQRRARVAAIAQDLLERHECDHGSWRWVRGPHECEECRHDLPEYIFECRRCHIRACNRCRRNRL
ncbi:hypothetical protein DL95DRAFT_420154 [Leptodontidium sp. 2 PMI_412]|nr:hypothetical protein DL95DRAFT_420154 [Leptodontidium sp. 2 PMI_412]